MNTNSVQFFNENKIKSLHGDCELIVAAWEIGNPGNIGNIIRLAHNIGAVRVLFIANNPKFNTLKIKKTAGFSFDQMKWEFVTQNKFYGFCNDEFELVVLETCTGAKNIYKIRLPPKAIILAGNESHGLPDEIIQKAKQKVFIPIAGGCKSMNVSHALAVAGFEWFRQNSNS